MKTKQIYIASLAALLSGSLFGGTMGPVAAVPMYAPVVSLSIGPAWYGGNGSHVVHFDEGLFKRFTSGSSDNAVFSGELLVGFQNAITDTLTGEVGIAVAANTDMKFSGIVREFDDPRFDNFSYSYKVRHTRVGVKGKLIGEYGWWVQPYVSGGVDAGFNRAHKFQLKALIPEAVLFPRFQEQTKATFAWTVGAGIQKPFWTHWRAGIGYEYAGLGKSRLGIAPAQAAGNGLSSNSLYTNELQFSLSYVA